MPSILVLDSANRVLIHEISSSVTTLARDFGSELTSILTDIEFDGSG